MPYPVPPSRLQVSTRKGRALAGAALFATLGWLSGWAQGAPDIGKIRARAEQADVEAQNALGTAYNEGQGGLKQDYAESVKWFRRAAERGFAPAQYNLGLSHELGHGVPADERQAFKYYLMAAEQGFAAAQFNVGNMYASGRGIGQDQFEANLWFKQAAEKGIVEAQFNLGLAYEAGRGVRKDEAQAARWYKQAADRGFARAQHNLALLLEDGRGVAKNEAAAAGYYRAAAEQGFAAAQTNYGLMLSEGRGGLAKDPVQAFVWLSLAAENGANAAARDFAGRQLSAEQRAAADQMLAQRRSGQAPAAMPSSPSSTAAVPFTPAAGTSELVSALEQARDANAQYAEANQRLELEKARLEQQLAKGGGDSAGLIGQLRAQSERLAAQVQTLTADKEAAEREVAVLSAQVRDARSELARQQTAPASTAPAVDASSYETRIADLSARLEKTTASLAELQAANQQLTEGNARLQQEKDAPANAPAGGETPAIVANLQRDNARLNDEVKRSTLELLSLNSQIRNLRNEAAKATAPAADAPASEQVAELNGKLERAAQEAVRLQTENSRLAARVTELESQPKPAAAGSSDAGSDAQKVAAQLQQQVAALQAEKADLEKWSRSLEQTLDEKSVVAEGATANLTELRQKVTQVQQQLDDATAENRVLAGRAEQAEQALAARGAAKPDNAALEALRQQLAEAQQQGEALTRENRALAEKAQQAGQALAARAAEKPADPGPLWQRLTDAQQQVEKLTEENRVLADNAEREHRAYIQGQARVAALERDLRDVQKPVTNAAEVEDLKNQLVASNQLLEKNSATVAELTGVNDRLEKELAAARKGASEVTALQEQLAAAQREAATAATLREENLRLARAAEEAADLRARNSRLAGESEQLAVARNDLGQARARVADLEKQLAAAPIPTVSTRGGEEAAKLRTELADANVAVEKLNATVAELTGANDRLEKDLVTARKAAEAALAAQSQAVSAAQPDAYRMEISTLQARVRELEGQNEEDRNNSAKEVSALAAQLALTRETNRSLTEANRALMAAKQAEAPTVDKAEFDQLQTQVRGLTTANADLDRQNDRLARENEGLVARKATLEQQLADARKAATTVPGLADEKAALQERLEAAGAQLLKAQQEVDTLQKENADATSQTLAARTAAEKAQADLAALQGRATDAEKSAESQSATVAELTGTNSKLEEERDELRRQLGSARAENARLAQATGSLEQLKAEAERSAQQNIGALSAQLAQTQRDLQSARETNSRIMEGNTAQERDRTAVINQLRAENTALAARLAQAQGTLDQIASAARLGTPAAAIAAGGSAPTRPVVSAPAESRVHTVAEGDSLSRISMRYYGTANRWQEIYHANRDVLQNSSTLRIGMQLRIP